LLGVCVCVCVRESEREREKETETSLGWRDVWCELKKKNLKLASIVLVPSVEKPQNNNFLCFVTVHNRIFIVWFHQT
jgi:hypothetical protein